MKYHRKKQLFSTNSFISSSNTSMMHRDHTPTTSGTRKHLLPMWPPNGKKKGRARLSSMCRIEWRRICEQFKKKISSQTDNNNNNKLPAPPHLGCLWMEKENQDAFVEVFRSTIKALNDHNIRYYLSNGNLLAYERHGVGFMPWDDDIDIVVLDDTELEKIRNIQWKNYKLFLFDTKYPDKQLLESFHRSGGDINTLFADITLHLHSMHPVQKGMVAICRDSHRGKND